MQLCNEPHTDFAIWGLKKAKVNAATPCKTPIRRKRLEALSDFACPRGRPLHQRSAEVLAAPD